MGLRLFLLFLYSLTGPSCAYKWGHGNKRLPENMTTVAVDFFENQTPETGVEEIFTNALIKELRRSGFAIVTDKSRAEGYFKGKILDLTTRGQTTTGGFLDSEGQSIPGATLHTVWDVNGTVELSLFSTTDNRKVWSSTYRQHGSFRGALLRQFGLRSSNALYNQSLKEHSIQELAAELVEEAFDKMTEVIP